jgi:hypothetical protein
MTALASHLVAEGLERMTGEQTPVVAEEPSTYDPDGREE